MVIKTGLFPTFFAFILISTLPLTNAFAQDYTQWELPEGAITRLGKGYINEIQYSPDDTLLAVASSLGIWLYDTAPLQETALLTEHAEEVLCVAFSPDGKTLLSGGTDGTIHIWNRVTGTYRTRLTAYKNAVYSVAFGPDGSTFVSGNGDGTVRLWNTITGEVKIILIGQTDRVLSVAFSPDGNTIATGGADNNIHLWDTHTKKHKITPTGHTDWVNSIVFSPDGNTIATGGDDNNIHLWNAHTGKHLPAAVATAQCYCGH